MRYLLDRFNLAVYIYNKAWPSASFRWAWSMAGLTLYQLETRGE